MLREYLVVLACFSVLALPICVAANPPCNGQLPKNPAIHCGTKVECDSAKNKTDCLNTQQRLQVDTGVIECKDANADQHCGDKAYPCDDAAGIKCTCAWKCIWVIDVGTGNAACESDAMLMEPDPCNPGQQRQVCTYQREKESPSCDLPGS